MRSSTYRAPFETANAEFDPGPLTVGHRRIAEALQRPPRVPVATEMAVPAADGTVEHAGVSSSCVLALALGRESDIRLLFNGAGEGQAEPLPGTAVLVWAPLPSAGRATALAFPFAGGPQPHLTSGFLAGALEFLEMARGPLRTLRLLESSIPAHCCGSDQLVELATEELVLRATLHQPAPEAGEDLLR